MQLASQCYVFVLGGSMSPLALLRMSRHQYVSAFRLLIEELCDWSVCLLCLSSLARSCSWLYQIHHARCSRGSGLCLFASADAWCAFARFNLSSKHNSLRELLDLRLSSLSVHQNYGRQHYKLPKMYATYCSQLLICLCGLLQIHFIIWLLSLMA